MILNDSDSVNKPQLNFFYDEPEDARNLWRPIHYLGSKLRLASSIKELADQIDPKRRRIVDLFAGSGTVSAAFAAERSVTAVDIQEYSRVICAAILNPVQFSTNDRDKYFHVVREQLLLDLKSAKPLIEYEDRCLDAARSGHYKKLCELIDHASVQAFNVEKPKVSPEFAASHNEVWSKLRNEKSSRLVFTLFGGLYFSYEQSCELDALLKVAHTFEGRQKDVLLASIISTASDIVNTVGQHFAQPIRPRGSDGSPKKHLIGKILRDRTASVIERCIEWLERYSSIRRSGHSHEVISADYSDALFSISEAGVVYADPPYTRDHYSRFYHVLETMCLWDDPEISTTRIRSAAPILSRGMYRTDRHQSPFCIKSKAPGAFEKLFAGIRKLNAPLILSYSPYVKDISHPRVLSVEQISSLASQFFKSIEIVQADNFTHMKLNATRLHLSASSEAEIFFVCR